MKRIISLILALVMVLGTVPAAVFAQSAPEGTEVPGEKLACAGQFAFLAVTGNGYAIEPCYVTYAEGDTVKDALKNSGYGFEGLDSGFISAIEGVSEPFVLHFDGDGYRLDTPASAVSALWFTTNNDQGYSDDLLNLTVQMARFNTASDGLKDYADAGKAYTKAAEDFIQTGNAKRLWENLKGAMDAFYSFDALEKVAVTLDITRGDSKVTSGKAVFTSEYNSVHSFADFSAVMLAPANYRFDISDGSYHHVRGNLTVSEDGATLTASLSTGTWIQSFVIADDSYEAPEQTVPVEYVTESSATYYLPDCKGPAYFPYIVPAEGVDPTQCKVWVQGEEVYPEVWQSAAGAVTENQTGLKKNSLEGAVCVFEARKQDGEFMQYQTFTATVLRTPTLQDLDISGDGTKLNTGFDPLMNTYSISTTSESLDILAAPLCQGVTVCVNGQTGTEVNVPLADCPRNGDGTYKVTLTLSAPGCRDNTYTVTVTQTDAVEVTVTHDTAVSVAVTNDAGGLIAPISAENGVDIYRLIPGQTYTWVGTKNVYYHTTAAFTAKAGLTVNAATPKTEDWATGIGARITSSASTELTPDAPFAASDHEYTFRVESNNAQFRINAGCSSYTLYTVTLCSTSHNNSNYSALSSDPAYAPKYYEKKATSATSYYTLTNLLAGGGYGNEIRIQYEQTKKENGVTYYQDYFVHIERDLTLNGLSATDAEGIGMVLTQKESGNTGYNKLVKAYTTTLAAGMRQCGLSLKILGTTSKYDFGFTVTLTNGDWHETVVFDKENTKPHEVQTVVLPLSGTVDTETFTVTVSHTESAAADGVYILEIQKLPPVQTVFHVSPEDAVIFLTDDATGNRIFAGADGSFTLNTAASYTYVITAPGYVGQSQSFAAGEDRAQIIVDLQKAPDSTLTDLLSEGDWPQFRADDNNNGVVDAKTPIRAEDAVLEWASKIGDGFDSGATGCPIIVGGYLYTYAGNAIHKINKETGEVVKSGVMAGSSSFAINSPTYAEGMIFVGLSGGRVQAFSAETLESLWVFADSLGGQPNCPIAYADGYVYTGFWNSETRKANFVCLSVTDEDTANPTENKLATWTYTHNGFYWAGAYVCGDFLLIGTDDGANGYTDGYASILSLDPVTGRLLDEKKLTNVGDQRSSICYDPDTDAYYFTTKGGDLYQVRVNADGTFVNNSLRRLHLENGADDPKNPPMSTSTPVICQGRAYIGVSGVSQFGAYSGHNMTVVDLASFSVAYTVPTMGYPQTSGLLTTAYTETDGYVYVYFIDNYTPGMIRVLRDKKGMTEPDSTYLEEDGSGYILFTPHGDEAQYAICSPIADAEGNLYFKNDTAKLMRLSNRMTALEITCQPEDFTYCPGQTFDASGMEVTARYANGTVRDVTAYVSFTREPLTADDTEITVSFAPDKLFECSDTPEGGFWQWYRDGDGKAGQTYYLPTATVTVEIIPVAQVGQDTYWYLSDAIAACKEGQYVKLLENVEEDIVIDGVLYLDLNGKILTGNLSGEGTLYGMDSATDGYTAENMGRITGTVTCNVARHFQSQITGSTKRYLAVNDGNGFSFHRFYMGITQMTLVPDTTAFGYKALFAGDEYVAREVTGFGCTLWVDGYKHKAAVCPLNAATFDGYREVTARVSGIDPVNFGETALCAETYICFGEETVRIQPVSRSLRQMVEAVNSSAEKFTAAKLQTVAEMIKRYYSVMKSWQIENILQ